MSIYLLLYFLLALYILFISLKIFKYNILINKQKEFIGYISHEIKTPIANSIFQADCIINDIKNGNYTKKSLIEGLKILNLQLLKSGDLSNKLFNIEKHDMYKYKLFKKEINLNHFLNNEIKNFQKRYKDISFDINLSKKPIYIKIDVIQFTQVINNLINNSIKFCNKEKIIIKIKNYILGSNIFIIIEDNGIGLKKNNIKYIFDKYSTGKMVSSGLGIGLYLCKKIIKLHNGTISANKSDTLCGAKFTIKLINNSAHN